MSAVANVAINVDARDATGQLRQLQGQAGQTEKAFSGLTAVVGKLAIAATAIQAARFVFAKTAELESQTRSLQVLTGSAEKAKAIIQELQQLGAVTPFTSTELIDAAKRLQAFGVEADRVVETTKRLADVSGATGAELQGLVTAYGQVQAKGRLQGEELLQFQERGIALQEELRRMYSMSGDEFQKALSKGQISAKAVEVAVQRLTDAGGKYANGAIAQSDTLAGKLSTLQDGVEMLAKTIGDTLKPALKGILDLSISVIDAINKALAGPDYKKANDRLFNVNARIKELQDLIQRAEKSGAGTTAGAPVLGVDGQVMGGGVPVLPGMRFELQQLQAERKNLEARLKGLRQQSRPQPRTQPSATPPLLEPPAQPRTRSMDELIGGDIARQMRESQAALEAMTARNLRFASQRQNADQAERMVKTAAEYQKIQIEILALTTTLAKRDQVRALFLKDQKDQSGAALAWDEQSRDIQSKILELQYDLTAVTERHITQIDQASEKDKERLADYSRILAAAQLDLQLAKEKDPLKRAELQIDALLSSEAYQKLQLTDAQVEALRSVLLETEKIKTKTEETIQIFADMSSTFAGTFGSAIDAMLSGTDKLGASLQNLGVDLLKSISKMLIMYGIAQALGALGGGDSTGFFSYLAKGFGYTPKRAMGGPVTAGQPYMVGERGPELFVPSSGGNIVPNGQAGGSGVAVTVNVDAKGTQVQGNDQQGNQLGRVISAAVQQELIKQQRPGGLLAAR